MRGPGRGRGRARGRGRGRDGGRGRGRGARSSSSGPTLPAKLLKLTAADAEGGQASSSAAGEEVSANGKGLRGSNSTSAEGLYGISSRKARRKAERSQKKHSRLVQQQQQPSTRAGKAPGGKRKAGDAHQGAPKGGPREAKRPRADRNGKAPAAPARPAQPGKRPAAAARATGVSSRTKFQELLEENPTVLSGTGLAAQKAEIRLQNELAKKLKLRKGRQLNATGDGLDDLLGGLDSGTAGDGASSDEDSGSEGGLEMLGRARARQAAAAAGESSDDEGGQGLGLGPDSETDGDSDLMLEGSEESQEDDSDEDDGEAEDEDKEQVGLDGGGEQGDSQSNTSGDDESGSDMSGEEGGQAAPAPAGKYVPPAARKPAADVSEEDQRVARRVRGLLNRLAEANIQGVVNDLVSLYSTEGRRVVRDTVLECVLQAVEDGPRATEQFTAVAAAFVAGFAAAVQSQELAALFMERAAASLERALVMEDSLACHNLARLIGHLFCCGLLQAVTVFGLLRDLMDELGEGEVSLISTLFKSCGLQLRASDPEEMKAVVLRLGTRTAEKAREGTLSKRAEIMMAMVVDVKNNKRRDRDQPVQIPPAISKWLRQSGVDEIQLRSLPWSKLKAGQSRKGMWWLPQHDEAVPGQELGGTGSALGDLAADTEDGTNLLKAAAAQRMNTDARRAVFCCVMGADDYMDAFERLLRLPLKAQQEREMVRVVVECCLQEQSFNPYYAALLGRLVSSSKNHKITLQYCLWDHFKEIESLNPRRATNLARLTAHVLTTFGLTLTTLKVVDFSEQMSARQSMFWRTLFMNALAGFKTTEDVTDCFKKLTAQKQLQELQDGLLAFLQKGLGPWLAQREPQSDDEAQRITKTLKRLRLAEKLLLAAQKTRF